MKLSKEEVKKVAKLSNLNISTQEEEKYAEQLSKILDYIDQLGKADIRDLTPTYNVSGKESVLREDKVGESLSREEALKNASKEKNSFFVTKGVFDDE